MSPPISTLPFRYRGKRVRIIAPDAEPSCSGGQKYQSTITFNDGSFNSGTLQGATIKESTFRNIFALGCMIINSNITDSTLKSCTLVNCTLKKSNIGDSKITEGKVFNSCFTDRSYIQSSQAWNCQLANCTIERSEIHRSKIQGGTVIYCRLIQSTNMTSAVSEASKFLNCDIQDSNLSNCHLHQTKLTTGTLVYSLVTKSPLAFRKFPPEVRALIFGNGVSLELLVALKTDSELYWEAEKFLDTSLPLIVTKHNKGFRKAIPRKLMEKVTRISIRDLKFRDIPDAIYNSKKLTDLNVQINYEELEFETFLDIGKLWTRRLGTITTLSFTVLAVPEPFFYGVEDWRRVAIREKYIDIADTALRVRARMRTDKTLAGTTWYWQEKDCKDLYWGGWGLW